MKRRLGELADQPWDLLVIGGGIAGAGVARDAALRGLRVALVEKEDFASGTSSRSTKLIHGGFRYLEQGEFRLVAEACRERTILQKVAPHLVRPQSFLLPVYDGDPRPLWQLRFGMGLYDWLAGQPAELRHRALTAAETLREEPRLNPSGLRGSIRFYDCQTDDVRLCLEVLFDACQRDVPCVNYCEVVGAERVRDRLTRVWARDVLTGRQFDIRAQVVVNAAGPWVEHVVGITTWDPRRVALSPTKGVHLLLPLLTRSHGIFFRSQVDRRMLFAVPWGDWTLLGTTDTDFRGDARNIWAESRDVDYLLDRLHAILPAWAVDRRDVLGSFAGIRPLLRAPQNAPSNRSREYQLVRHGRNLLSIVGGKYTTFRAIAEHTVDQVFRLLDRRSPACRTADTPLAENVRNPRSTLGGGPDGLQDEDVRRACERELAVTVADVLRRRTRLALGPHGGPETAARVSRLMSSLLNWDEATRLRRLGEYVHEWEQSHAWQSASRG
ncbi:MAG: glycerol-3-phosphate dehydrogenase/oxidase [Pirellulaceae bacterium]